MKKALIGIALFLALFFATAAYFLLVLPRPPDTTDQSIFRGDVRRVDHCALPLLDGSGAMADDIPKAYTPGCGWTTFPMPVLAKCSEPLAPGVTDMRGLWRAYTGLVGHVERIEQCGDRTVVTTSGIIHDFHTDGTLANGSRDTEPPLCFNTFVSIDFDEEGVMNFHPFGLPTTIVTRRMEGEELVWTYPAIEGEIWMKRICQLPEDKLYNKPPR